MLEKLLPMLGPAITAKASKLLRTPKKPRKPTPLRQFRAVQTHYCNNLLVVTLHHVRGPGRKKLRFKNWPEAMEFLDRKKIDREELV